MEKETTPRGFQVIREERYPKSNTGTRRLVQESSAIGDYPDAMERPGSSALWVGTEHHLNRKQVAELRDALTHWLQTGRLFA